MTIPSRLLKDKLLKKGFINTEIELFVKDVDRILQSRPDAPLLELGNCLYSLGWNQVKKDATAIQLVRDHC